MDVFINERNGLYKFIRPWSTVVFFRGLGFTVGVVIYMIDVIKLKIEEEILKSGRD